MKSPSTRLRILHATPFLPYPPDSGGKLVPYHYLEGLARRGHEVILVAPIRQGSDQEALGLISDSIRIVPVPCRSPSPASVAIRFAILGQSIREARHTIPPVKRALERLLEQGAYDVAILDSLFTAYLLPILRRKASRMPAILVDHNVESLLFERYLERKSAMIRTAGRLELARIRRSERNAIGAADKTIALSEKDRQELLRLAPGGDIVTLPPGAPVHPGETIPPPENRASILFLGNYRWQPNRQAARWLVEEIFPRVRDKVSEAVLKLAGEDPAGTMARFHRPDACIHVLGRVEDPGRTMREAAVFIVPLLVGGGVRLKILEALANERPVATTTIGCEGIPLVDGENAVIADDARSLADETAALLRDPERAERLARAGRRLVEEEFGWDAIVERLEGIIRESAGDTPDAMRAAR